MSLLLLRLGSLACCAAAASAGAALSEAHTEDELDAAACSGEDECGETMLLQTALVIDPIAVIEPMAVIETTAVIEPIAVALPQVQVKQAALASLRQTMPQEQSMRSRPSQMAATVEESLLLQTGIELGKVLYTQVLKPAQGIGPRTITVAVAVVLVLLVVGLAVRSAGIQAWSSPDKEVAREPMFDKEAPWARETAVEGESLTVTTGQQALEAEREAESQATKPWQLVLFFVVGHCISASTLTIANKWAMNEFHPPPLTGGGRAGVYVWTLTLIQFVFAAVVAKAAGLAGLVTCEPLEVRKCLAFFPAAGMFMITIVAGNAVMNYASVNAFLILRSVVPLPVALVETVLYGDPYPSFSSWASLLLIVAGAVAYGYTIGGLELDSISWAILFLVMMPIDAILIKHSITASGLKPWSLVYYNNVLAAIPCAVFVFSFELKGGPEVWGQMIEVLFSPGVRLAVATSCLLGLSISFFQLNTRLYISATGFMVLGVLNKFITVFINAAFMDRQGWGPMSCVLVCLGGAVLWQQSAVSGAIKVRPKDTTFEKSMLPMLATVAALIWAGVVEHNQVQVH